MTNPRRGKFPPVAAPRPLDRVSVRDAVAHYVEILQRRVARNDLSETTLNTYVRDLDEFVDLLGAETILDDIEADDIESAMTRISRSPDRRFTRGAKIGHDGSNAQGRGPHALARWFAAVRGLFRFAAERGYVQVDPTASLKPPKVPRRAQGARLGMGVEDAVALRQAPSQAATNRTRADQRLALRDEALLRILVESGPRVSEVCGANRADVHVHPETGRPVLRVRGKGNKTRDVPLSAAAMTALEAYQAHERPAPPEPKNPDDRAEAARLADAARALFVTVRGNRLSPRDVQRLLQRYATERLGRHATPHALRHTALTALVRSGVDVATVAQIAGHASVSTTSIYLDDSMVAAADAIDASPLAQD